MIDHFVWCLGSHSEESQYRKLKGGRGNNCKRGLEANASITLDGVPAGGVMGLGQRMYNSTLISCIEMIDGEKPSKMHVTVTKGKHLSKWTEG